MNADGLAFLDRLELANEGDRAKMIGRVDRAAAYAEIDRGINEGWFNELMATPKMSTEAATVYLLRRLLNK